MKYFSSRMTKDGIKVDIVSTVAEVTPKSKKYLKLTRGSGVPLSMLSPHHQTKLMRGESIDLKELDELDAHGAFKA
jgi:hypothetical protein